MKRFATDTLPCRPRMNERVYQPIPPCIRGQKVRWAAFAILVACLLARPAPLWAHGLFQSAETTWVQQEIQYDAPDAGQVTLVWGINGWGVVTEEMRPAGTIVDEEIMHSPMEAQGTRFVAKIPAPQGATVEYGFLISQKRDGSELKAIYDGSANFQQTALQDGVIQVESTIVLDPPLVQQEIHYQAPAAGEVMLVWGVNGWQPVPPEIQPAGTALRDGLMHTPMQQSAESFAAELQVPADTILDYGFLITRKQDGRAISAIWDGDPTYQQTVNQSGRIDVQTQISLAQVPGFANGPAEVGLYLLYGVIILLCMGLLLARADVGRNTTAAKRALVVLTLLGLAVRLWAAWDTNQHLPDTSARLAGDEAGYDYLATALLQGEFFQWPGRTPIYPLFLAASYWAFGHSYAIVLYIQAVAGATAIPFTYITRLLLPIGALMAVVILHRQLGPYMPILMMCGYFTLIHAITFGNARHSEPLQPLLIILVVQALSSLWQRSRQNLPRMVYQEL
ncbi:MAG: hypothetical protein H6641_20460 [Caldilineaceae bacterium]|nr:hypothetical protein [Caldilineaceae bacterium]